MKNARACFALFILFPIFISCSTGYHPKAGDVLFQDLLSPQGQAVKLATGSEYTHCGIVFQQESEFFVYEAVGPVVITPLEDWIAQGVNSHFVARRYTEAKLSKQTLTDMESSIKPLLGKSYDIYFNWSDDELYCSELVWKAFHRGGEIKLTRLRKLESYNLTHPIVKAKLAERYGDNIPLEEPVVAPSDLFDTQHLTTVYISKHNKNGK